VKILICETPAATGEAVVAMLRDAGHEIGFLYDDEVTAQRPAVSVVIPAKNESANIGWVLRQVPAFVDEVILVDGCSTDDTIEAARRIRPGIVVVNEERAGKGAALRQGFERATGDVVVMIDADGSMMPTEISRLLHLLDDGFDFVKGSRFMAGGSSADITPIRNLGNGLLVLLVNRLWGARFTDLCYGFCAFHRRHLDALALRTDGFEIETEIVIHALRAKLRITEVPSMELERLSGVSNLHTVRDGLRVLRTIVRERLLPAPSPRAARPPVLALAGAPGEEAPA
jgi:glycosyltransferase involved in cell wall biosynthesis